MEGSVIQRIASIKPFSTKTERIVIDKLEKIDFNEIIYMSITELAMKLDVAEATILRFCKKIGYKGFQDFKLALSKDLASETTISDKEENFLLNKILAGLDFTSKNLNKKMYEEAAKKILAAKRLCVFGVGNSEVAVHFFELVLLKLGISAFTSSDSHLQNIFASSLNENDLVVLVSVSGGTLDVIDLAEVCKQKNVPIVVVTNYEKSPLAKYANYLFVSSKKEAAYEGGSSASIISQIYIFDMLYQAMLNYLGEDVTNKFISSETVSNKAI